MLFVPKIASFLHHVTSHRTFPSGLPWFHPPFTWFLAWRAQVGNSYCEVKFWPMEEAKPFGEILRAAGCLSELCTNGSTCGMGRCLLPELSPGLSMGSERHIVSRRSRLMGKRTGPNAEQKIAESGSRSQRVNPGGSGLVSISS